VKKGVLLPRGFKAQAERIAIDFRSQLNLKGHDPLSAFDLANHLKIPVLTPIDLGMSKDEVHKLQKDSSGWSGLTMKDKEGKDLIIHNGAHSPTRQQSNIMHELAHIICNHKLPEPKIIAGSTLPLRKYDGVIEEEANYLGGNLQITRIGLLWALKKGMTVDEIGNHFMASQAMVNFRIRITGVNRQFEYSKRFY
jgi:Zn-dependent peptidase ImmA (M78 family)